jgi:hypothetical protein
MHNCLDISHRVRDILYETNTDLWHRCARNSFKVYTEERMATPSALEINSYAKPLALAVLKVDLSLSYIYTWLWQMVRSSQHNTATARGAVLHWPCICAASHKDYASSSLKHVR